MTTSRYAFGELPVVSKYMVGESYAPATCVYSVGVEYPQDNQQTYPSWTITTGESNLSTNLLEKKLKLYENIIEYLMSLLSQEDKESIKELSELLSKLSK